MSATEIRDWVVAAGALAAVGAVIAAFVQIADERASREQSERRVRSEDLREQAEGVSAWPSSDGESDTGVVLLNRSGEPVYRAVVSLVMIQGAGPRTGREVDFASGFQRTFAVIPPGEHDTTLARGWAGMGRRPGVELAFTDRAGVHWRRSAEGRLRRIDSAPARYYRLPEPLPWELP